MLVLRLFHIVAGALWFGSAFLFPRLVGPAGAGTPPAPGARPRAGGQERGGAGAIQGRARHTRNARGAVGCQVAGARG